MNCKDVQSRLPDFLAGVCSIQEQTEIAGHLENCRECSEMARGLRAPIVKEIPEKIDATVPVEQSLRRMSLRFKKRVATLTILVVASLAALWLMSMIIAGGLGSMHANTSLRALYSLLQFSQPDRVVAFGNRGVSGFRVPISVYVRPFTGLKPQEQREYKTQMSAITGSFESPVFHIGSDFIHPDVTSDSGDYPEAPWVTLGKSGENTVATISLSLPVTITLEEAASLVEQYDLELLWMAVEAGIETFAPRNMIIGGQALQWGLPGTFRQFLGEEIALSTDTIAEYRSAVLDELAWLDHNKGRVKPDPSWLKHNAIDNSVGDKAAYILEHGIRVYGLHLTGPSAELVRLGDELALRKIVVADIDFWYWQ